MALTLLIFGETGQVATALRKRAGDDVTLICLGRDQADLGAPDMLRAAIDATDADVIINAAAYTAVDKAETDSDHAEQVNHLAVGTMARAAAKRDGGKIAVDTGAYATGILTAAYVTSGDVTFVQTR